MSKRSSTASKSIMTTAVKETASTEQQEPCIQKHVKFWDRKNKGYITPLDTISGFITLGYSVLFSIAIGAFVGIFLSLSTQTGWFPDPLCRSNVRNFIRAKKQTQRNQGAFDENGVFVSEKFDSLFSKYAKSDKSGKTITVTELVKMTKEQERLEGKNVKAWATSMVELCTAYFFIGHHGTLTKEDVRSAYDGTLFYRLKDNHRLMIKQGGAAAASAHISSTGTGLGGSYLLPNQSRLSVKGIEHRFQALLTAIQAKSSAAVADYQLRDWFSYIDSAKKNAMPRVFMRPPTSGVKGVSTPKTSIYRSSKKHQPAQDPASLFSDGLTGVAKPNSDQGSEIDGDTSFLNSFLQRANDEETDNKKTSNFDDPIMFRHLTKDENELLASAAIATANASSLSSSFIVSAPPAVPKKSISSSTNSEPLMRGFLRNDNSEDSDWLIQGGITGVQRSHRTNNSKSPTSPTVSGHSSNASGGNHVEISKKASSVPRIITKQQALPPVPPPQHQQQPTTEIPKSTITPPPEDGEKKPAVTPAAANYHNIANPPPASKESVNNKKVKRKNKRGANSQYSSGQVSPISSSESSNSQDQTKYPKSPIDASWGIAADVK